ncbi:hypothetical protein INS49_003350 [Diaporthe citri]|uniref:uncharacterized protein n=1 Tax=Diaporthe citri TaxID=83186 RepID=UPI001C7F4574|nr:uncharacterized protein INS49_003350 [Diaporthe citri]KAG6355388.1 hypothetical protein INS49_003350 [Diaporthe citri]
MADNDHKGDIKLTGAQETLLLTLIARARDTESTHPILNDTYAASVVKQDKDSGYGFSKRLRYGLLERPVSALISLRTRILDLKTEAFLAAHPGRATVLHLACGLDSRSLRVKWQDQGRLWVDVDKQDVVELRRQVTRDPSAGPGAEPVVVIMEGLRMYLERDEVYGLLRQITWCFLDRDVHGEIYFDAAGTITVNIANTLGVLKQLGTSLKWSLSHHSELEKEVPGLKFQDGTGFPKWITHDAFTAGRLGTMVRNILYVLNFLWPSTRAVGIYSYRFRGATSSKRSMVS